jgi:hypothetical protein
MGFFVDHQRYSTPRHRDGKPANQPCECCQAPADYSILLLRQVAR